MFRRSFHSLCYACVGLYLGIVCVFTVDGMKYEHIKQIQGAFHASSSDSEVICKSAASFSLDTWKSEGRRFFTENSIKQYISTKKFPDLAEGRTFNDWVDHAYNVCEFVEELDWDALIEVKTLIRNALFACQALIRNETDNIILILKAILVDLESDI